MVENVYLITENPDKIKSAKKAFEDTNINLKHIDENYPEIQASSSLKIARYTVTKALEDHNKPVIREDHSIYLNAIPGFP